jgi:hypothetical protein
VYLRCIGISRQECMVMVRRNEVKRTPKEKPSYTKSVLSLPDLKCWNHCKLSLHHARQQSTRDVSNIHQSLVIQIALSNTTTTIQTCQTSRRLDFSPSKMHSPKSTSSPSTRKSRGNKNVVNSFKIPPKRIQPLQPSRPAIPLHQKYHSQSLSSPTVSQSPNIFCNQYFKPQDQPAKASSS